jgi:VIT1/CCC1 family predicted Fe2+/Mn2+ transporter
MMTSKQYIATTTDAGIASPSHEYWHTIGPDGFIVLQGCDVIGQRWPTLLDTTGREEVGLDLDERGSPWSAAMSILLWFTLGAVVMVLPYVFGSGMAALSLAIASASVALFAVGAAIGQLNTRGATRSGTQLLLIGGAAVLIVVVLGHLAGASTAG